VRRLPKLSTTEEHSGQSTIQSIVKMPSDVAWRNRSTASRSSTLRWFANFMGLTRYRSRSEGERINASKRDATRGDQSRAASRAVKRFSRYASSIDGDFAGGTAGSLFHGGNADTFSLGP